MGNIQKPEQQTGTSLATTAVNSIAHTAAKAGRTMLIGSFLLLITVLFGCAVLSYLAIGWLDHGWY